MKRIESLDSLRGVAAMVLVFHHCAMTLPRWREAISDTYVLRPLVIGSSAVLVFFVLSGFVLYLTFDQKDGFRYWPYFAKRVARIWLPLAAAILMSLLLVFMIDPRPVTGLSAWFNQRSWHQQPSLPLVVGHLLLLDPWRFISLDNVIWSLVHEMRISIGFPLIAFALKRSIPVTLVGTVALSTVMAILAAQGWSSRSFGWVATLQYLALFAAGGAIAIRREALAAWFAAPGRAPAGLALLAAGVVLLCCEGTYLLIAIGAVATVLACFAVPSIVRVLEHRPLVWLGRTSYSLYLFHLLVLLTLVHLFAGKVPTVLLLIAVLPLSLIVAELGYCWIERPAIAGGRRLAARRA